MPLLLLMLLVIPPTDEKSWPTLGLDLCEWMERKLAHGPGDLRGKPLGLNDETRAEICRLYEVFPQGHPRQGRRRFKRGCLMLAKGLAKTELLALIAIAELHPEAPVRCAGFGRRGRPIGVGVPDPFIPLVAYTEEQSDELAYGALRVILEHSKVANEFDIGLERVMRAKGDGVVRPFASAPDSNDGARTTFQGFDESHRFRRKSRPWMAHKTMQANIPKRRAADAWSLETTTAFSPGEGSVAEAAHNHAVAINEGKASDPAFFFFYRCADPSIEIKREDGSIDKKMLHKAIINASGPAASWRDVDGIASQWDAPDADHSYLSRVWLNRIERDSDKAFDLAVWRKRVRERVIPKGALVALGFAGGGRVEGAAAIVATEISTGHQDLLEAWERPAGPRGDDWVVPEDAVEATMRTAFDQYEVALAYANPQQWESTVAKWSGDFGKKKLVHWWVRRETKMALAVRAFRNAIAGKSDKPGQKGETLSHDGDPVLTRHLGNACRRLTAVRDEQGERLYVIQADRDGAANGISAATAAILSWQARLDAIALGMKPTPAPPEQSYKVDWVS